MIRQPDTEQLVGSDSVEEVLSEQEQSSSSMPDPVDPALDGELDRLEDIKDEVELSLSDDIPVSRVTATTTELIRQLMTDTHAKAKKYALGMTKIARKFPALEESFKLQYDADGKSLLKKVNQHIDLLLETIQGCQSLQQPQQQAHVPQHAATAQLTDSSVVATTLARAAVKYTDLLERALSAKQDAEEDNVYLATATDERISRLVHKISKYEKHRDIC